VSSIQTMSLRSRTAETGTGCSRPAAPRMPSRLSEADDPLAPARQPGQADRPGDEEPRPDNQQNHTDHHEDHRGPCPDSSRHRAVVSAANSRRAWPTIHQVKPVRVPSITAASVPSISPSLASKPRERAREDDHGPFESNSRAMHRQRGGQRRHAEDAREVENVGADDVSHRQVALPLQGGQHAHDEFGERGANRDDREADDGGGDPDEPGDRNGTPDQRLAAASEQYEAEQYEADRDGEGHSLGSGSAPAARPPNRLSCRSSWRWMSSSGDCCSGSCCSAWLSRVVTLALSDATCPSTI